MKRILIIVLFLFAQPAKAEQEVVEKWECVKTNSSLPIVTVWVYADTDIDGNNGKVAANGIDKAARYEQPGFSHRWDFDPNLSNGNYESAFVIDIDGTGRYYHFGKETKVKSSLSTRCRKKK